MKILITGNHSYIGSSFKNFLKNNPEYIVDNISVRDDKWKYHSFKNYDVIIHLAALVHKNEKKYSLLEYERVNVDLTIDLAKKASDDGVKNFFFLSTMAVFGKRKVINSSSPLNPSTKYGISKLKAEYQLVSFFQNSETSLTIFRPPMVYGRGAPGNPRIIEVLSKFSPFFPETYNTKSFIHIDKLLSVFLSNLNFKGSCILHPKDENNSSTFELYSRYRSYIGKKAFPLKLLGLFIKKLQFIKFIDKIFGNQYYDFHD